MRKAFIEAHQFTEWVKDSPPDEQLSRLQQELMNAPDSGVVMPGCGGLRKLRTADPGRGRGKRGGARVIDLHLAEVDQIHSITIYGKDQKEDLSSRDKALYRQLVQVLKTRARGSRGSE